MKLIENFKIFPIPKIGMTTSALYDFPTLMILLSASLNFFIQGSNCGEIKNIYEIYK